MHHRRHMRIITTILAAVALTLTTTPLAGAQNDPAAPTTSDSRPAEDTSGEVDIADANRTPAPGRENLDPTEPGFNDNTVDNHAGANWHPTDDPKPVIIPGKMRSDTEEIPGGFTKEEADRAETQEAAERDAASNASTPGQRTRRAAEPINCTTYWPSPFKVCGAIRDTYDAIGGPTSFLLFPRSDELGVPDGVGRRNEFVNGFIYWHPDTGAHPITTHFSTVWARNGWEAGRLGYPTTDEFVLPDGVGRKQSFQRGHIYGSLAGLASIEGLIYDKWVATGAEGGPLGYPTADEAGTPDGIGRFNGFTGGMVYWTPSTGAHPVMGVPLAIWGLRGFETSQWGYPTTDPEFDPDAPVAVTQKFQNSVLDSRSELEKAGTEIIDGKEISSLIIELLRAADMVLSNSNEASPARSARAANICSKPDSSQSKFGGVSIPAEYDYWGCVEKDQSPEPSKYGRHDFCTKSPDQFPSPGKNAHFGGACARHDMCYDVADSKNQGYQPCNGKLYDDMNNVCNKVYSGWDPRRYGCRDFRDTYWVFVTGTHLDNI